MASSMEGLYTSLRTLEGQLGIAAVFAIFWAISIEIARRKIATWVKGQPWWPRALPNQISVMENFGYPKGKISEPDAIFSFVWIITMCITHVVSASLMIPVVVLGWEDAGQTGQTCFLLGTLSEVGFDIFDFSKCFLLAFCPRPFPFLGPQCPLKTFVLIGIFHHTTVLGMTIPMNLYYPKLEEYHQTAFALLFSAGVCYLSGQYKYMLDAKNDTDLATIKRIMWIQFVMNVSSRIFVWFPSVYTCLNTFYSLGDMTFFRGACCGALGMTLYNLLVVADATGALIKWLGKSSESIKKT